MERLRTVVGAVGAVALWAFAGTALAGADPASPVLAPYAGSAVVGGPAYTPQVTASSGPVTFAIDAGTTHAACALLNSTEVTFDHAGICVIDATDSSGTTQQSVDVAAAETATALVVGATSLTATVSAIAPGAGTPNGTVLFTVAGRTLGSAALVDGAATLRYAVPANVTESILATYPGVADFQGSGAAQIASGPDIQRPFVARPSIAARLTSDRPRNRYGWWHTSVRVRFTCRPGGAPIVGGCPRPIVLARSGANLTVTRTIATTSGVRATLTLRGIKIDLTVPRVRVSGISARGHHSGRRPTPGCAASDPISGIRTCRLSTRVRRQGSLETITYTATATSWAGAEHAVSATVAVAA